MIRVGINGSRFIVRNLLGEITFSEGLEILDILQKDPDKNAKIAIITTLSNIPMKALRAMEEEDLDKIFNSLHILKGKDTLIFFETFKLGKKTYGFLDLKNITVREYAQYHMYLEEQSKYGPELLATLFRPIIRKSQNWKNILNNKRWRLFYKGVVPQVFKDYEIEKLSERNDDAASLFHKHIPFDFGMGALAKLQEFEGQLRKEYPSLYKTDFQLEAEANDPLLDDEQSSESGSGFGFYELVCDISSDIFERDEWWERPLREFFKYVSFLKYKNAKQLEEEKIRNYGQ